MDTRKKIIKFIDYSFQNRFQLTESYDDSNSMRYLSRDFDITVIGRFNIQATETHVIKPLFGGEYKVTFLPSRYSREQVLEFFTYINPSVFHFHGNHSWKDSLFYVSSLKNFIPTIRMIFSPAGSSCGTEEFLKYFNKVIVNHPLQIQRMRCDPSKVIVRKRSADPLVFYPVDVIDEIYDFVFVSGFVPQKRIDLMIDFVKETPYNLVIIGDFTRTEEHFKQIVNKVNSENLGKKIFLHNFIKQIDLSFFLGKCKVWVWPNIRPENPETTTNRAIIEALACGLPLLVGERAFKDSDFIREGFNGYKYCDLNSFKKYADICIFDHERMGKASRKLSKQKFDFRENFINFYNNLYSSI